MSVLIIIKKEKSRVRTNYRGLFLDIWGVTNTPFSSETQTLPSWSHTPKSLPITPSSVNETSFTSNPEGTLPGSLVRRPAGGGRTVGSDAPADAQGASIYCAVVAPGTQLTYYRKSGPRPPKDRVATLAPIKS